MKFRIVLHHNIWISVYLYISQHKCGFINYHCSFESVVSFNDQTILVIFRLLLVDVIYSVKIHELNELKDVYSIINVDESYGKENWYN